MTANVDDTRLPRTWRRLAGRVTLEPAPRLLTDSALVSFPGVDVVEGTRFHMRPDGVDTNVVGMREGLLGVGIVIPSIILANRAWA